MRNIVVAQPGARLHYAVPQILAQADLLAKLYTDIHGDHSILRRLEFLQRNFLGKKLGRLLGRRLPQGLVAGDVYDFPFSALLRGAIPTIGDRSCEDLILRAIRKHPWQPGNILYTVLVNSDLEVLPEVRARGVKLVHECIVGPDIGLILREENALFPHVTSIDIDSFVEVGRERDRRKYELVDLILVPSEFTRNAVLKLGASETKVIQVPYGLDFSHFEGEPKPEAGRVFFAGKVGLLKGSHYLAEAYRILRNRGRNYQFRVAGSITSALRDMPLFEGPTYLGQIPRASIGDEFRRADVFVLPTLSDSFSLAHLEAMCYGVPVITTTNCGSVVTEGVEGHIVPIRDARALADRIEEVVENRELRDRMSIAARVTAEKHSIAHYAQRLIAALAAASHNV